MRASFGTHQSSGLSEMSSQFQDECSAVPALLRIESRGEPGVACRNFVRGPATFTTGCSPMVLVDHATPAGVEGAQDVAVGFSGRR